MALKIQNDILQDESRFNITECNTSEIVRVTSRVLQQNKIYGLMITQLHVTCNTNNRQIIDLITGKLQTVIAGTLQAANHSRKYKACGCSSAKWTVKKLCGGLDDYSASLIFLSSFRRHLNSFSSIIITIIVTNESITNDP